jgi:hypothetical protein
MISVFAAKAMCCLFLLLCCFAAGFFYMTVVLPVIGLSPYLIPITILAFTPIFVTVLHVYVGMAWRADFLLGRLDTVRDLSADEYKNLHYQVIECIDHVSGFASDRKKDQIIAIYGALNATEKKEKHADLLKPLFWGGQPSLWTWWRRFIKDGARYGIPALFLSVLYLIGFILILHSAHVRCEGGFFCLNAATSQTSAQGAGRGNSKSDSSSVLTPSSGSATPSDSGAKPGPADKAAADKIPVIKPRDKTPAPTSAATAKPPAEQAEIEKKQELKDAEEKGKLDQVNKDQDAAEKTKEAKAESEKAAMTDLIDCLIYAFVGCFVFNTGIMVRRIFVWDISGQMFWWAAYRVMLSLGLAVVLHYTTDKLDPHLYFLLATASVSVLDGLTRNLRTKLFQADAVPKQNELSLQLVQGIDYWKEQRLMEEGIESVQHLATADFVLLALHTRSPLYTIMDWVDQAIFIQRFPGRVEKMKDAGLPVSAVELAWGFKPVPTAGASGEGGNQASQNGSDKEYNQQLMDATGTKEGVLNRTIEAWRNDNQVQLLTLFWKADLGEKTPRQGGKEPNGAEISAQPGIPPAGSTPAAPAH